MVDNNARTRDQAAARLAGLGVHVITADSATSALDKAARGKIDSLVLTPRVSDAALPNLLEDLSRLERTFPAPTILYVGNESGTDERGRFAPLAHEFGLPLVDTVEQLVDHAAFALCCPITKLNEADQQAIRGLHNPGSILRGKRVLIVDDDIRNIFALTSILERNDVVSISAETGRDAINFLQAGSAVDIVLMDIMMPEMDGIDTMKAIRQGPRFRNLPIVAVTAKAMKGDREKCIEAGAWDYLSKPVDPDQMLSVLHSWLTS